MKKKFKYIAKKCIIFNMKRILFISLGCVRNLVDTEVMIGLVLKKGLSLTTDILDADFIVVNTCSFIKAARKEGMDTLKNIFFEKKRNAKVIVTGCLAQYYKKNLLKKFPNIFYLLGSGDMQEIENIIFSEKKGSFFEKKSFLEKIDTPRCISTNKYAYVKISEGCLKRCSYCIIPKIKGTLKSKSIGQIVSEVERFLQAGSYEIILIAQDLGDYGKDLGIKNGLKKLLEEILKIKKDFWLRLLYLYPDNITPSFIEIFKDPRICRYLDIPLQHVNNDILKRMRRNITYKDISEKIEMLKKAVPDIILRTTFMVGFSKETEKQFLEVIGFIKKYRMDHVGAFPFSKETKDLVDNISKDVKQRRMKKIYQTQERIIFQKNKNLIGKRLKVVIDNKSEDEFYPYVGRYYGQAPEVDPIIKISGKVEKNPCFVEIKNFDSYDLFAKIVE